MPDIREVAAQALAEARRQRCRWEAAVVDLQHRVDNAQQLADMGDYEWAIPTDTTRWSDQLYRIFGYEPQSQKLNYAAYMAHCHPDDKERITEIHQHSYATGEPFQTTHRIIRTDGQVRHLLCNGEVVMDETGAPVSMRGTAIDITGEVEVDQSRETAESMLREERTRRKAALEINDNVVQGLTAALYALESDDLDAAGMFVRRTLEASRRLVTDMTGEPKRADQTADAS